MRKNIDGPNGKSGSSTAKANSINASEIRSQWPSSTEHLRLPIGAEIVIGLLHRVRIYRYGSILDRPDGSVDLHQ